MPTEETGVITSYETRGEEKVIRANRDIKRSNDQVADSMQAVGNEADLTARKYAGLQREIADLARENADLKRQQIAQARQLRQQAKAAGDAESSMLKSGAAMSLLNVAVQEGVQLLKSVGRELQQTAVELFENTEEGERLTEAWDTLKDSLIVAIVPFEDTKQLLNEIAIALEETAGAALDFSQKWKGAMAGGSAAILQLTETSRTGAGILESALQGLPPALEGIGRAALGAAADAGLFGREIQEASRAIAEIEEQRSALENQAALTQEAAESARDYSREIESLARLLRSAASAQAEFNERQGEITRGAEFDRVQAATDRFVGLAEVESDLQDEIQDINRDANRAVERAQTQHERSLTRIAQRGADQRAKMIQQNRLRREFDERRFDLSALQDERLYLFERQRLAAAGDSLAIGELDDRFALQQQIEEENFRLQQQRQEATFALQLRFQEQAARQQAAILVAALDEQLRTIEAGRQERVTEAEAAAQEERMEVKGEFALEIAAIDAQEQEKLLALEKGWNERQAKEAENLAEFIRKNDVAAVDVLAAWHTLYGPDGTFDALVLNAMRRAASYAAIATAAITGVGNITTTGGRVIPRRYRAHGGDEIVSSETHFIAGEAGPERIITQPLSSIGGAMTVRWQGGAIPVEGRGQLEGMNTDAIGQAMAQGLVSSIERAFLHQRGNWGR